MGLDHREQHADLKAVIFDYGEVLCHRPTSQQFRQLAAFFGLSVERLSPLWEKNRGPYDCGDLTSEAYWSMLAQDAGIKIGPKEIEEICKLDLTMWSNVNSNMVDWVGRLRSSGLKVGLLSNMHPEMVTHCRSHFDWLQNFDFVTFSAEAGIVKPDPAIYEYTLRGLGIRPSAALFLDDREINIQAARSLGINAIHVRSMKQLRDDLKSAGFTILPRETS